MNVKTREVEQHYGPEYTKKLLYGSSTIELRRTYLFEPHVDDTHRILDFGCGPGDLLDSLPGEEKYGVEIGEESRKLAAAKGVIVEDALDKFHGMTFDRVISSHALEHVLDPASKLSQFRELMDESSLLLLLLPMNVWADRSQRRWCENDIDMHLYTWTPLLLGNLLKSTGFQVEQIQTIHSWPPRRGLKVFSRMHPLIYRVAARGWSAITCKRQVFAIARRSVGS
ncbi:hypothetical protein AB833_02630 [Chromatiales bacterium (ex Bugula neritina AB1)]|nr:hypothetical protein AB833_02630 [Chromatiales bacterium (ex Bugula neritina AB1)]